MIAVGWAEAVSSLLEAAQLQPPSAGGVATACAAGNGTADAAAGVSTVTAAGAGPQSHPAAAAADHSDTASAASKSAALTQYLRRDSHESLASGVSIQPSLYTSPRYVLRSCILK
jgi:hypothetical protein